MITEDYISFEVAKLLKEKGFDEPCIYVYRHDGSEDIWDADKEDIACQKPTIQMAMKWLREVHKIHIEIGYNVGYFPVCISTKTNETIPYKLMQGKDFTYEQACEVAIKYCLENLI